MPTFVSVDAQTISFNCVDQSIINTQFSHMYNSYEGAF